MKLIIFIVIRLLIYVFLVEIKLSVLKILVCFVGIFRIWVIFIKGEIIDYFKNGNKYIIKRFIFLFFIFFWF